MGEHVSEDAVWQRMLAALETVPHMRTHDLDGLRRFVTARFLVMRSNMTWVELGQCVPSADAARKRFRRWAKRGVFDRLMGYSQPVAQPDVLHVDSTSVTCHRTATGARGGGPECIGRSRGGLTTKVHHAVRAGLHTPATDLARAAGRLPPRRGADYRADAPGRGGRQGIRRRRLARALARARHRHLRPTQAQPPRAALLRHGPLPHPALGRDLVQLPERLSPPQPAAGQDGHQLARLRLLRRRHPELAAEGQACAQAQLHQ